MGLENCFQVPDNAFAIPAKARYLHYQGWSPTCRCELHHNVSGFGRSTNNSYASMTNNAPTKLGKYEVLQEIGRGSMGIVYLGHDPFINRQVAIKVAHPEAMQSEETGAQYRRMFFNEAHTAGKLTHPNIVAIHDAGMDGDIAYIVMEYIKGCVTLKDYTQVERLLPLERVVEIAFKCAKALDYAHGQGVIHRDIKPTNILVTEDMDVKISDFSIAHLREPDTVNTLPLGMVGSPRYMAPEQIQDEVITNQADLFALGLVMYELIAGRHPFNADNFSRLVEEILNKVPAPLREHRENVPESLERIVAKALEKRLEKRYASGLDMAVDLTRAFDLVKSQTRVTAGERFNAIKELDFFQGFRDQEIDEIVQASSWQDFSKGEQIILEGDLDDSFYIIIHGSVMVRKGDKDLRTLQVGDCFGEMGYLAKTKRTASIFAKEDTALLKLNSTVIGKVSLECQVRFLKVFLRTLIHRLSVTTAKVSKEEFR
jgi:serine/threonine protein kinase